MNKFTYKFANSNNELNGAFAVRKKVFVEEQGIPEELEWDEHDKEALHIVAKDANKVIGTARILFLDANQAKLERMAVLKRFRHKGVGRGITSFVNEELRKRNVNEIFLHAQYRVVDFYKSCGFEEVGTTFCEAGIEHIKMHRQI